MATTVPGLSPPGTAKYSSNTLHVGDGTWDSSTDTFLLPNIEGLNFDTMRYNGMGNRFAGLPEYHSLIIGHGVLAAITFLAIVPAAILIAQFYHKDGYVALRVHITLNVLTVIFTTIIFILGFFAVGPERALTNPHHGIGLAIYVLILFQALWGCIVHRTERGKERGHIPVRLMLHQWIGRATALLAVAQIPIGLTLYGSPVWLFIVYALIVAAYVVLVFILNYEQGRRHAIILQHGSYVSGTDYGRHRFGIGALTGAVASGVGIEAMRRRFSGRQRYNDSRLGATDSAISSRPSDSIYEEKYGHGQYEPDHTKRNRIVEGLLGIGAIAAAKHWYDKRRGREEASEADSYRPPLGGAVNQSSVGPSNMDSSVGHVNALEEGYGPPVRPGYPPAGQPPYPSQPYGQQPYPPPLFGQQPQPDDWQRVEQMEAAQAAQAGRAGPPEGPGGRPDVRFASQADFHSPPQHMQSEESYDSRDDGRWSRGFLGGLVGFAGLSEYFRRRRDRKEQDRVDAQRIHEEESQHMFGAPDTPGRFTGDGTPRWSGARLSNSHQAGDQTGSPQGGRQSSFRTPTEMAAAQQAAQQPIQQPPPPFPMPVQQPPIQLPPPRPFDLHPPPQNIPMPAVSPQNLPPPPSGPPPQQSRAENLSAVPVPSPGMTAVTSIPPPPHQTQVAAANRAAGSSPDSPDSHPVSVKVKMYNDGRHVTLRRLNEEEAAAEREARRRENRRGRFRRQDGSDSDVSSNAPQRYRRAGAGPSAGPSTPAAAGAPLRPPQPPYAQASPMSLSPQQSNVPLTSPPSGAAGGAGQYDTGTDLSNPQHDENRRRRRAERSKLAPGRQGVDFE